MSKLRSALKVRFAPYLEPEGFYGKFPEFKCKEHGMLHLLSVEFDRWGGGFFLEFAPHAPGPKEMPWGEIVPENELAVDHAPFDTRARLQNRGSSNSTRESWFRFDGLNTEGCDMLMVCLIALFPQVDAWLRKQKVGPNVWAI